MKFTELGLNAKLLEGIARLGFETPTPVQAAVIPVILEQGSDSESHAPNGRDLVALAQTGTGKTAAFGLPVLQLLEPDIRTPQALILCPTRELCMQIARDLQNFAVCSGNVRILAVYGGADIKPQLSAMVRGVDIVVATPGRMNDLLRRKRADFSKIRRVVLDEADEMLNMGFEEDLEAILSEVPEGAQTLLFSATMPREVASIAKKYMTDPREITVGTRNAGAENVSHEFVVVHAKDRYRALRRFADAFPDMYGIVFCRTRQETQEIADQLGRDGYNAEPLHGDLTQAQRDRVMKKFRSRGLQMLVATDVAARGIDVNDLTHVINYSLPDDLGSYTHRSGRTGRAGKTGVSIALINMREHYKVKAIEKQLGRKFVQRTVPTGADVAGSKVRELLARLNQVSVGPGLIDEVLPELEKGLEHVSRGELLRRFAAMELQAVLERYAGERDINAETVPEGGARSGLAERSQGGPMVELVMHVGKINGLGPKELIHLVNSADRKSRIGIGRINITPMQTYFQVPASMAHGLIESFHKKRLVCGGRQVGVAEAMSGADRRQGSSDRHGPKRFHGKKRPSRPE